MLTDTSKSIKEPQIFTLMWVENGRPLILLTNLVGIISFVFTANNLFPNENMNILF